LVLLHHALNMLLVTKVPVPLPVLPQQSQTANSQQLVLPQHASHAQLVGYQMPLFQLALNAQLWTPHALGGQQVLPPATGTPLLGFPAQPMPLDAHQVPLQQSLHHALQDITWTMPVHAYQEPLQLPQLTAGSQMVLTAQDVPLDTSWAPHQVPHLVVPTVASAQVLQLVLHAWLDQTTQLVSALPQRAQWKLLPQELPSSAWSYIISSEFSDFVIDL
jgi:hypothetical protein